MRYWIYIVNGGRWWVAGIIVYMGVKHLILATEARRARRFPNWNAACQFRDELKALGYDPHITGGGCAHD